MLIPFNIKYRSEVESGKYRPVVKVGMGEDDVPHPARIICWDRQLSNGKVVALAKTLPNVEAVITFDDNGLCNGNGLVTLLLETNEHYYYISAFMEIEEGTEGAEKAELIRSGNYFEDREKAVKALMSIKKTLCELGAKH